MKALYIDMDNVPVDFTTGMNRLPEDIQNEFEEGSKWGIRYFSLMDPTPGAIVAFEELSIIYDTYILLTAPGEIRARGQISCCG